MHHVAVALERHQFVDGDRAELGDTPDVVAGEVDEHHVLGTLLRVLDQLSGHHPVVLVGATPPSGAGDRPRHNGAAQQLDHRLR